MFIWSLAMSLDLINTEDFINEVESRPVVWDVKSDEYSNKVMKRNAWEEIIVKFVPDFNEKSKNEKNKIGESIQRKWKSLRASYTRELLRKKSEKGGSLASGRKQYIYFDQLRFLEPTSKATKSSVDEVQTKNEFHEGEEYFEQVACKESCARPQKRRRGKQHLEEEYAAYKMIKNKITKREDNTPEDKNEDTMFMMSLVPEFKKIPDHARLRVKSDLLNVLLNAQQYYSSSAAFDSAQLRYAQNHACRSQFHDPAQHKNIYSGNKGRNTGEPFRLSEQLQPLHSPTGSEFSEESLVVRNDEQL